MSLPFRKGREIITWWERQVLMKRPGCCTVNKFSGHGNRIPEEAVEGYIFRGTKDSWFQAGSGGVSVRWGETLTQKRLVPSPHGKNMLTSLGSNKVETMGHEVCRGWENQTVGPWGGRNALVKYICSITLDIKPLYTLF